MVNVGLRNLIAEEIVWIVLRNRYSRGATPTVFARLNASAIQNRVEEVDKSLTIDPAGTKA
jgi:hypothetical protein